MKIRGKLSPAPPLLQLGKQGGKARTKIKYIRSRQFIWQHAAFSATGRCLKFNRRLSFKGIIEAQPQQCRRRVKKAAGARGQRRIDPGCRCLQHELRSRRQLPGKPRLRTSR